MSDFGRLLNSLIQCLPPAGGIVTAPPGATAETVLVDRPCTIRLGYGVYEYTGRNCLFDVHSGDVRIAGSGQGNTGTTLLHGGTAPAALIRTTAAGCFAAARMCLKFTGENSRAVGVDLGPYASASLFQLPRFNACPVAIRIAPTCEDNVLLSPSWETPGMGALVDQGVRTIALVGSRGPWDLATVPLRTLGTIAAARFEAPGGS